MAKKQKKPPPPPAEKPLERLPFSPEMGMKSLDGTGFSSVAEQPKPKISRKGKPKGK